MVKPTVAQKLQTNTKCLTLSLSCPVLSIYYCLSFLVLLWLLLRTLKCWLEISLLTYLLPHWVVYHYASACDKHRYCHVLVSAQYLARGFGERKTQKKPGKKTRNDELICRQTPTASACLPTNYLMTMLSFGRFHWYTHSSVCDHAYRVSQKSLTNSQLFFTVRIGRKFVIVLPPPPFSGAILPCEMQCLNRYSWKQETSVTTNFKHRRPAAKRTYWTFDAKTAGCDSYFGQ